MKDVRVRSRFKRKDGSREQRRGQIQVSARQEGAETGGKKTEVYTQDSPSPTNQCVTAAPLGVGISSHRHATQHTTLESRKLSEKTSKFINMTVTSPRQVSHHQDGNFIPDSIFRL